MIADNQQWLWVSGTRYKIVKKLSSRECGRFLVQSPNPKPKGTPFVAVLFEEGTRADQFVDAIKRVPSHLSGIPKLTNHGFLDGKRILVFDYLPGVTLDRYFTEIETRPDRRMSCDAILRLTKGLVHGLRFLHESIGIIHGDIKPENIVVANHPAKFQLIDFGSAWSRIRQNRRVEGDGATEMFSAPEVFGEGLVDHRADQFSIGMLLYLLLTCKLPFEGVPCHRLLKSERREAWIFPSEMSPDMQELPKALRDKIDSLVKKLLSYDVEDRFQMTTELVKEFESICEPFRAATYYVSSGSKPLELKMTFLKKASKFLTDWLDRE